MNSLQIKFYGTIDKEFKINVLTTLKEINEENLSIKKEHEYRKQKKKINNETRNRWI